MSKMLKSLLLSSTFALVACGAHQSNAELENTPVGIQTSMLLDKGGDKVLNLDAKTLERCADTYKKEGLSGDQLCVMNVVVGDKGQVGEQFTLAADCKTHSTMLAFNDPLEGTVYCTTRLPASNAVRRATPAVL